MGKTISLTAMIAVLLPAAAMAEQAAEPDRVDVAYEALAAGQTDEAVAKLTKANASESDDPAALINLGTAYARQGRAAEARAMFIAAMESSSRSELELADGSWVDSRRAAKIALARLEKAEDLVMR